MCKKKSNKNDKSHTLFMSNFSNNHNNTSETSMVCIENIEVDATICNKGDVDAFSTLTKKRNVGQDCCSMNDF